MPAPRSMPLAAVALGLIMLATPAGARDVRAGALRLTDAWSRPTPPGARVGIGYVTIANTGNRPDRLLSGTSPAVERVEFHEMKVDGGVMRMRPVAGGIVIPPGTSVVLGMGGHHVMLIGPRKPFVAGGQVPVTLRFEKAGALAVNFDVRNTPPQASAARKR